MPVQFAPPIEIFLGLTLNAVGGVFGLNRTVDTTGLRGLVRDGRTNDVLIPHDLIARADLLLSAVATVFPAKPTQYLAAPILELGWGRPVSLVTMTAGVVFTFPNRSPSSSSVSSASRFPIPMRRSSISRRTSPASSTSPPVTSRLAGDAPKYPSGTPGTESPAGCCLLGVVVKRLREPMESKSLGMSGGSLRKPNQPKAFTRLVRKYLYSVRRSIGP